MFFVRMLRVACNTKGRLHIEDYNDSGSYFGGGGVEILCFEREELAGVRETCPTWNIKIRSFSVDIRK
jgi:hypothetical protein